MVPPFLAVPTPFLVETSRYTCYANCAWDALGVPAMRGTRTCDYRVRMLWRSDGRGRRTRSGTANR